MQLLKKEKNLKSFGINMNDNIDVLVIGSGGAGLSAALEAKYNNAKVIVLSKTYPTHSQTCQAQGGINAAMDNKKSSIQSHIDDTFVGGHALSNKETIKVMCEEAPKTIQWLDQLGVPFSRDTQNNISQRKFGAASQIRTCYSSDYTGLKILHTLYDNCIKEDIPFLNEYLLLNIIKKEQEAIGITVLNIKTSEVEAIYAKSIIIATGGYSNLYNKYTTNSNSTTGDGIAAAFRAGCELSNMEMIQFHPTAMSGNNILISESARGEGGYLVDSKGERFIDELKARDVVARAIYTKLENEDKVFLDLRHIDKDKLLTFMPQEYRLANEFLDIELDKDLLPINPAAHYSMGGIKANVSCETTLKNLYACGECAQNGLHGANRLGGNSLQEIITFGKIAGKNASINSINRVQISEKASEQKELDNIMIKNIFDKKNPTNFYKTKKNIGKLLFEKVGLFREEKGLNKALEAISKIQEVSHLFGINDKSKVFNKNLVEFLEFKNILVLSEIVIRSAQERKESRGAHYRSDFKEELESYTKNSIAKNTQSSLDIDFEEII